MRDEFLKRRPTRQPRQKRTPLSQIPDHPNHQPKNPHSSASTALIQKQNEHTRYSKVDLSKSKLGDYSNYNLAQLKANVLDNQNRVNQTALRNRQQQLIEDIERFKKVANIHNNSGTGLSRAGQQALMQESTVKPFLNIRKDESSFMSPPSQNPNKNMGKEPAKLPDPSISTVERNIKNMSDEERWQYAENKIKELEQIKASYIQNGGNDQYFLDHLQNLYRFYNKLKTKKLPNEDMRLPTPINKLRDLAQNDNQAMTNNTNISKSAVKEEHQRVAPAPQKVPKKILPQRNNPPYAQALPQYAPPPYPAYPPPYMSYPPPYYPPPMYPSPPQPANNHTERTKKVVGQQNIQFLEKMLALKDQENKKLIELLQKKEINAPKESLFQQQRQPARETTRRSRTLIDEEDYSVQPQRLDGQIYSVRPLESDLLPEERVLISLQKEQMDELALLGSLPEDLQKLKFEAVKRMSELRVQMEKEVQAQRLKRMKYQEETQREQEDRLFENQAFVDQQRRQMLSSKLLELDAE